jgi:hypothetical protein
VVQAPGFIRGINPKSIFENPQAPAFIRGINLKSQISNLKSIDGLGVVFAFSDRHYCQLLFYPIE